MSNTNTVTTWDKLKRGFGYFFSLGILIGFDLLSKNGIFEATKKKRKAEKERKREGAANFVQEFNQSMLIQGNILSSIESGNNTMYRIRNQLENRDYFVKQAHKNAKMEVAIAAMMNCIKLEGIGVAKYYLKDEKYVISRGVNNSFGTLVQYIKKNTGGKMTYLGFLLKKENEDLLKQYIKIQELNLLFGNMDCHNNNIMVKKDKNGKLKLVAIDFDNQFLDSGLLNYKDLMHEAEEDNDSRVNRYIKEAKDKIRAALNDETKVALIQEKRNNLPPAGRNDLILDQQKLDMDWSKKAIEINDKCLYLYKTKIGESVKESDYYTKQIRKRENNKQRWANKGKVK